MVLAMVPLAIISNGTRVMITAIMANYIGPQAAEGFMHEFSGWVIFVVATILFLLLHSLTVYDPQEAGLVCRQNPPTWPKEGRMKSGRRYWLMIAVLGAATAGMAMLSHGEATPPAKSLAEFPKRFWPTARSPMAPGQRNTRRAERTDYLTRDTRSREWAEVRVSTSVTSAASGRARPFTRPRIVCRERDGSLRLTPICTLQLDDGRKVPINLYIIRKGLDEQVVLYWYQSHGRVVASEYLGQVLFSV